MLAPRFERLLFVSEPTIGCEKHIHPSVSYLPMLGKLCDTSARTYSSLSCLIKRVTFHVAGQLRKNWGCSFCYKLIF